jgi:hypothetical protein
VKSTTPEKGEPRVDLPPFMHSVDGFDDIKSLREPWQWLVPASDTPLLITIFGDWVFGAPDGSIWALSVLEGTYERIASGSDEYNRLKTSVQWLDETFIASWQEIAFRHGLAPTVNQCLGWKLHPILGGAFAVRNLQIFGMQLYQQLVGQLHRQIQSRG